MLKDNKTINLTLPFRMGSVNCYLIQTDAGFVLIDTGGTNSRKQLVCELENASYKPGLLKLIILTHRDFDYTGNAAYLRKAFRSKIATHNEDLGIVERGDMFVNRKKPNLIIRMLLPIFSRFGSSERFVPDLLETTNNPALGYLTDDLVAANASVKKLANMGIGMVYPGHGNPFLMHLFEEGST